VDLGPQKRRAILAVLLLDLGQPVSVERLIDLVWGDEPPPAARRTVIVHVSRIRASLRAAGVPESAARLVTAGRGYALEASPDCVDLHRFHALRAAAANVADAAERSALLSSALALWRGPALDDLEDGVRDRLGAGLAALRLAALEDRLEADLECGRHHEVAAELAELARRHPEREHLLGSFMLALYRDGRATQALEAYQRAREAVADEFGAELGARVRDLQWARGDRAAALGSAR
jgi:DNA-binding SARP family transcriptional activator